MGSRFEFFFYLKTYLQLRGQLRVEIEAFMTKNRKAGSENSHAALRVVILSSFVKFKNYQTKFY